MKIIALTFHLLLLFVTAIHAQDSIDTSRRNAIVNAIETASPAVLTINVAQIQQQRISPFFRDFRDLFFNQPLLQGQVLESLGSGFLFDEEGHILTNYHILQNADVITSVTLPDGRELEVELVGVDPRTDLAVLKAKGENFPWIRPGDSSGLLIGEWAIAIGNPFGNMMSDKQPTVSVGVISATNRQISPNVGEGERLYQKMIQTDAAINPGNSGGPLINSEGKVIGVNTMIFSNSGGSEGLGFAIPINRALRVADEIVRYGKRRSPWFGFRGEAVDVLNRFARTQYNIKAEHGVLVTEINKNSPAFAAGLQLGDVVTQINREKVSLPAEVDFINWDLFIGDEVNMVVDRQGLPKSLRFNVEEVN